ncbi:MAG TPA: hypothetical protein PKH91_09805, partial [Flavobacterium sp.]|nr:hypothetical protein [Flavobacterium sp.]
KVKESFKNVNGFYMIFRKDSTYYSSKQPNHMSNWILDKNNSVIIFSDTKKPFIANYWIETVSLFNDTLILEDKIKNGFIKITLKT